MPTEKEGSWKSIFGKWRIFYHGCCFNVKPESWLQSFHRALVGLVWLMSAHMYVFFFSLWHHPPRVQPVYEMGCQTFLECSTQDLAYACEHNPVPPLSGKILSSACRISLTTEAPVGIWRRFSLVFRWKTWRTKSLKSGAELWSLSVCNTFILLLFFCFVFPQRRLSFDVAGEAYQGQATHTADARRSTNVVHPLQRCLEWCHSCRFWHCLFPPSFDIPDEAVKGRGGRPERKSQFFAHIQNVFLALHKPLLIASHIRPYLEHGSRKQRLVWLGCNLWSFAPADGVRRRLIYPLEWLVSRLGFNVWTAFVACGTADCEAQTLSGGFIITLVVLLQIQCRWAICHVVSVQLNRHSGHRASLSRCADDDS